MTTAPYAVVMAGPGRDVMGEPLTPVMAAPRYPVMAVPSVMTGEGRPSTTRVRAATKRVNRRDAPRHGATELSNHDRLFAAGRDP